MRNRWFGFRVLTVLAVGIALAGCAHRHHADADNEQSNNAVRVDKDAAAPPVNSDGAKVVFQSTGMPTLVTYSVSTSGKTCEGFDPVGRVFDSSRGVLLPWIAKLTEKTNKAVLRTEVSRTRDVQADVPLQIRGYSQWTASSDPKIIRQNSCGPVETTFVPKKGRTYLVKFAFLGGNQCEQRLSDITDAGDTPLAVQSVAQVMPKCGASAPVPDEATFDAVTNGTVCRTTLLTGKIGKSAELCLTSGLFAHDVYALRIDGQPVAQGIDDETTHGIVGQYQGQSVRLTCQPKLDAPTSVSNDQIDSVRKLKPDATRDELKKLYLSLNTTEVGRHCGVDSQSAELFSVDVRFP